MALYLDNLTRLRDVAEELFESLSRCRLCPRTCEVNRLKGERGYCGADADLVVSSYGPHFGEEPPLVGVGGSGTIFLTFCSLKCVFCQNYDISHLGYGEIVSCDDMAEVMLYLQRRGCHNINFVTPTHYLPHILVSVYKAAVRGLRLPLVYNCGGYESADVIEKLSGLIDIYMPDIKFFDRNACERYMNAPDYPDVVKEVVKKMHSQVGDLVIEDGIAVKGLLVRHLVMPGYVEDSKKIMDFISKELSPNTYVNIMDQYRPLFRAHEFKEIARKPTYSEYMEVVSYAESIGLRRGFNGRELV